MIGSMLSCCVYRWSIIYLMVNAVNFKKYVGQTVNYIARMNRHKQAKDDCRILNRAIKKYGWDKFQCGIVFCCWMDQKQRDYYERYFIASYASHYLKGCGYNCTLGGGGMTGFKHRPETIEKMRNSATGVFVSAETRLKNSGQNNGMVKKNGRGCITRRKGATTNPYIVVMMIRSKNRYLGCFPTQEKAQEFLSSFDPTTYTEPDKVKVKYAHRAINPNRAINPKAKLHKRSPSLKRPWQACIMHKSKRKSFGYFASKGECDAEIERVMKRIRLETGDELFN